MVMAGKRQCVRIKKNGKRCNGIAVNGIDYCMQHGGRLFRYSYKHGLYSKYQPTQLAEIIDEQRNNPKLMDLREQVANLSGMLGYLFEQTKRKMAKERRTEILPEELNTMTAMSERVATAIERTARVGLAVRLMVHVEALSTMIDLWIEASDKFIPKGRREEFRKRLAALASQVIDKSPSSYAQILQEVDEQRGE